MRKKVKRALALLFAVVFLLMQGSEYQLFVSAEEPVPVEELTSEEKPVETLSEEKSTEEGLAEEIVEKTEDEDSVEEPEEKIPEENPGEETPVREPAEESPKEPMEEQQEESPKEPIEEQQEEAVEEPLEEPIEEQQEEVVEGPEEEQPEEPVTFNLRSDGQEIYQMQITKNFVSKDGSATVNPPEDLNHIDLLIRQYYVNEKSEKVYVGGESLSDFSGEEIYENATCIALERHTGSDGSTVFQGTMSGVKFYTQFEVLDERMCRDSAHAPIGNGDDWILDVDSFYFDRHYEQAIVNVSDRMTSNSTVTFHGLPGTGFILVKGTSNCGFSEGTKWYLCMPSIPDDLQIQEMIIQEICDEAGKEGGLDPADVIVKKSEQIIANQDHISIDFLEDGTIDLIFTGGTKTWSMFYSGDFNFSGVKIMGEITNLLSRVVLKVSKTVEGTIGDRDHEAFSFYLTVTKDGAAYTDPLIMKVNNMETIVNYGAISFDPSSLGYEFSLVHGEEAEFTIPYGAVCEITEKDYSADGYRTGISNNGVKVVQNESIRVTNTKNLAPPTGVFLDKIPYVLMTQISIFCIGLWVYCSCKKYGGNGI